MPKHTFAVAPRGGASSVSALDIIQSILDRGEDDMKTRFQDPKILTRTDVSRPFYYILASVPVVTAVGLQRKRRSLQLGFCDEVTMKQAKARKQQILAPINAGRFLIQSQVLFKDLAKKFEDARIPQLGKATQDKYLLHLHNHLLPAFGNMMLCEISRPAIETWLNAKMEPQTVMVKRQAVEVPKERPGLGWYARTDLRNLLSAIFTKAAEWGLWDGRNPCEGVFVGKKKVKRTHRIPKPEDLSHFLKAMQDTAIIDAEGARLIIKVAVVSGLRVSEVLGLRRVDIDFTAETLRVEVRQHRGDVDDPKTEESRRVRQIGPLAGELLTYAAGRGPEEFVFQRKDAGLLDDRDLQQHVFRPAAEAVGIYYEGFGMHTFRRLNISWRQEAGATPFEAMKAAGHTKPETTWLYTITDQDREKQHVAKIFERLNSATKEQDKKLAAMAAAGGIQ